MGTNTLTTERIASRLYYLDYLRVSLVLLVVIHHVAMFYGAGAPVYYTEPPPITQFRAFQGLLVFILFNQSFFMGALFLLAGYFVPGSYDRKGPASFVRDKLLRLGVPLLVFALVLHPVSGLATWLMPVELTGLASAPRWADYPGLIGLGPSWFIAMLLVFNGGYAVWRLLSRRRAIVAGGATGEADQSQRFTATASIAALLVLATVLAGVTYLWRMVVPLGKEVAGFPTLAYLPQYLGFFVLGTVASRRNWLQRLPGTAGIAGASMAAIAALFLFAPAFSGKSFSLAVTPRIANAFGGGHWQSALYAAWDSAFSVGIVAALLTLYRAVANKPNTFGAFLSKQSYTVYLLHVPLVAYIAYLIRGIDLTTVPKFLVATAIIAPICFLGAWLIRKAPGATKVL
jgi:peptidoglycan/LPS O-acetylase OafA/YrhL